MKERRLRVHDVCKRKKRRRRSAKEEVVPDLNTCRRITVMHIFVSVESR